MTQAIFTKQTATELEREMAGAIEMPDLSVASFCTCGQHQSQLATLTEVAQSIENPASVHEADARVAPQSDRSEAPHEPDGSIDFGATPATSIGNSGFQNTDALVGGVKWVNHEVTYSFPDTFAGDYSAGYPVNSTNFSQVTAGQQTSFEYWFDQFAGVSGLSFTELDGPTGALDEDQEATIRSARDTDLGTTAFAYFPFSGEVGGDIWLDNTTVNPVLGDYSFMTIGHEIGHAVGLKHGHQGSTTFVSTEDSIEYSIMTYRSYPGHDLGTYPFYTSQGYAQSLMTYDIAALQYIYGANFNENSGDTTYTFNTVTGAMSINGVSEGDPFYNEVFRTIWDGDGIDTYDLSNYITDLILDLAPGSYSEFDAGGNFQRTDLGFFGPGAGVEMARGHLFNAVQYQGDDRSLIENATGGSGDDTINGNTADNLLIGNSGDDSLKGLSGDDTLQGGIGNDSLSGGGGNDSLEGGAGDDALSGWDGDDVLIGGNGNDNLLGEAGNDTLRGQGGDDTIQGGAGNDSLFGGGGSDLVEGNDGNDWLFGEGSADTLDGGAGDDTLSGSSGNDSMLGGTGNDKFQGQGNDDTIDGGSGNDTINGQAGLDSLIGGSGDDLMSGGGAADVLEGGAGNDTMDGGTERDLMSGGADDDLMLGGGGQDTMDGGFGNDTMDGGVGYDTMDGGLGDDVMDGGGGRDLVVGGSGNDTIDGGFDNDILDGGAGADILNGGNGNDLLIFSALEGGDIATGGSGADTFDFESGFGTAQIDDFGNGADLIDLLDVTTVTVFGDINITYSGGGSTASVDVGGGDLITLNNLTGTLTAGDFVV